MKIPRIFQDRILQIHDYIELEEATSHRLRSVLRLDKDKKLILFNGDGYEYPSLITTITRHHISVKIAEKNLKDPSSPLAIHLGQVISKGEKMDFVIQKATELGVCSITPLFSERSVVHLKQDRLEKKQEHWKKIAIQAAEQCGRTIVPVLASPLTLQEWVLKRHEPHCIVLNPSANQSLNSIALQSAVALLIGPEGGLTEEEISFATTRKFTGIKLGPRILRTETAALAAITALQYSGGDLRNA